MTTRWVKIRHWSTGIAGGVFLVAAVLSRTGAGQVVAQGNGTTRLNCDSQPCDAVARGRAAFNDRNLRELGGNGRACADCHVPSEAFQLSPAVARARFERLLAKLSHNKNADDPLFRPVDADDFRVNGNSATDFSNLVDNGLVRVTMPLPPNVRLIDPATCATPDPVQCKATDETFVDLWRAVMPVNNVAITGSDGVARNARLYRITLANGSFQFVTTSDTGRLLLTGQPADLGVMDATQLRGISRTAPYFHNNSAATLDEVLDHRDAFFRNVARRLPPPNLPPILSSNGLVVDRGFVRAALLAYLREQ